MARIKLDIKDGTLQITLRALLEADGHSFVSEDPEVVLTDSCERAVDVASYSSTIVLVPYSQVRPAVDAMKKGVYGYALLPLIPGEIQVMVRRAFEYSPVKPPDGKDASLTDAERRHILAILLKCRNNKSKAAKMLGIGRNTLWRKMKRWDIKKL